MSAALSVKLSVQSVRYSCSNTRSKTLSKRQDRLVNELLWQIIGVMVYLVTTLIQIFHKMFLGKF